jgi:hypothetical protein
MTEKTEKKLFFMIEIPRTSYKFLSESFYIL